MTEHHVDNLSNAAGSTAIACIVTFLVKQALPWAVHTVGALLTALVVATTVFYFNRWLNKKS